MKNTILRPPPTVDLRPVAPIGAARRSPCEDCERREEAKHKGPCAACKRPAAYADAIESGCMFSGPYAILKPNGRRAQ